MLVPLIAGPAVAQTQSSADRAFARLSARWLDQSMRLAPSSATGAGDHRFDAQLDDVSARGRAANLRFSQQTLDALGRIDRAQLSRANQVDAALLENALRGTIWQFETLQAWAWNPLVYQNIAGNSLYSLMAREFAPMPLRLEAATRRMELMPALLRQVRAELQPTRVPPPHAETYAAQNPGLKSIVSDMIEPHKDQLSASKRARLERAIAAFNTAVDEHQAWIAGTLVPAAQGDFRVGAEVFDTQLGYALQSSLTRAEIRQRADAALTRCREEMYRVSRQALAGRPDAPPTPDNPTPEQQQAGIRAALDLAAAQRPARDRVVEDATAGVSEAEAFLRQRGDIITLPDEPVRVIVMPEFQQGVAVAYCDSPGPLENHLETFYAISPIPANWTDEQATSFLREYNSFNIVDVGVHEAMPGHYVQIWHSNHYNSVLRAVLSSGSFVEGWAVYAEEMMVEQGFRAGDPLYRLSQLKMQLRSIMNAIIDQAIHVDGIDQAETMRLLTQVAFQEEREAAGKWRRAQLSFTQLSTYFVGYQEHLETRVEAERRQGAAFNLKTYHDGVLSFGSPPARYARALLLNETI